MVKIEGNVQRGKHLEPSPTVVLPRMFVVDVAQSLAKRKCTNPHNQDCQAQI
jgi:hypothetical protein